MSQKGYNAKLERAATADAEEWTSVARLKSIKPPSIEAKDIDTTVLDSADEFEESIAGLANGGQIEAKAEYSASATAALYSQFRVQQFFRIRYSDNSGWRVPGYLSKIGDDEVVNGDIVRTDIAIKVTGKPEKVTDLTA